MFVASNGTVMYENLSEDLKDKHSFFFYLSNCMEQSHFLQSNRSLDDRGITRILWYPEGPLPLSQIPTTCPCPEPDVQVRGLLKCFVTLSSFYGDELSAFRPTSKLQYCQLSVVRSCLLAAVLHIWKAFIYPQPENAQCCADRNPYHGLSLLRYRKYGVIIFTVSLIM
jgi:hypothetical protein